MIPLKKIKPKSASIKMTQNSYFKRDVPSNKLIEPHIHLVLMNSKIEKYVIKAL